jgi:hypothetical protein
MPLCLTLVTALAVFAHVPADAQSFKQRKGAHAGNGSSQTVQQGPQQLSGSQQNSSNIGVYMGAYAYQIARKCLDNILPECPKKK